MGDAQLLSHRGLVVLVIFTLTLSLVQTHKIDSTVLHVQGGLDSQKRPTSTQSKETWVIFAWLATCGNCRIGQGPPNHRFARALFSLPSSRVWSEEIQVTTAKTCQNIWCLVSMTSPTGHGFGKWATTTSTTHYGCPSQ